MTEDQYSIRDGKNNLVPVTLRRDKRLRRTMRWQRMPDGSLLVRVPARLPKRNISPLLEEIRVQLGKVMETYRHRTHDDLHQRAEYINRKYFEGKIQWNAIRWVSDMNTLLGSCTRGGTTDGEIRISDKIKNWPVWVVDYVIAHELMHRRYPNHSANFWTELQAAYPLTERARGIIRGVGFTRGHSIGDELEET
jgi:predicted metal-dependent hydrolase